MTSSLLRLHSPITTALTLALALPLASARASEPRRIDPVTGANCSTTREFVTALEFLRSKHELAVPEKDARKLAATVAEGCTGAAQRFIKVTTLLVQSGLTGKDAVHNGTDFARRSDLETDTFVMVFRHAYLPEYLDLDMRAAMTMARSLATEFEGNVLGVRDDFEKLLDYCVAKQTLNLPKPECGAFAARVAKKGQTFSGGIAGPFIALFEFMRSEAGPSMTTGEALKLAEELITAGPGSSENFIQAYKYATSKKGLAMPARGALSFANKMALGRTVDLKED